jgi:hypothetical protein
MPFWNTKPVQVIPYDPETSLTLLQETHGFHPEPTSPPSSGLEWDAFSLEDTEKLEEYHRFLMEHYKTPASPFQIIYTLAHLRLELGSAVGHWIVTLRSKTSGGIVAGIAGGVRDFRHTFGARPEDALANVLNIAFLCVHPALRHLGLAPCLIHEISRRANQSPLRIQRAYYNSITQLPGSFCSTWNYHRPVNVLRCIETGYVLSPTADEIQMLFRCSVQRESPWRFIRCGTGDNPEPILSMVNAYNERHRKVYEPLTMERWNRLCANVECVDMFLVVRSDGDASKVVGFISTVSHPYRVLALKDASLKTVLLNYYGFLLELTDSDREAIWDAFCRQASIYCDALTTIHPDVGRIEGFRKGAPYYHYMYNLQMMPLKATDITMIGI